jgi:hypothetical protein
VSTVERSYADWELPLAAPTPLRIDVVPVASPRTELDARGDVKFLVPVDVVLRKKFERLEQSAATGRLTRDDIDSLVKLVLEIHAFFLARRLASFEAAIWDSTEILAASVPSHLRKQRQFTGVVRVTYDVSVPA